MTTIDAITILVNIEFLLNIGKHLNDYWEIIFGGMIFRKWFLDFLQKLEIFRKFTMNFLKSYSASAKSLDMVYNFFFDNYFIEPMKSLVSKFGIRKNIINIRIRSKLKI